MYVHVRVCVYVCACTRHVFAGRVEGEIGLVHAERHTQGQILRHKKVIYQVSPGIVCLV
jgi:hypothetical protein